VVLVFLPTYSPDLQPAESLWRQWRPNVTHNHKRADIQDLVADSDDWLTRTAANPKGVLSMLGNNVKPQPDSKAA
jgi:transposase